MPAVSSACPAMARVRPLIVLPKRSLHTFSVVKLFVAMLPDGAAAGIGGDAKHLWGRDHAHMPARLYQVDDRVRAKIFALDDRTRRLALSVELSSSDLHAAYLPLPRGRTIPREAHALTDAIRGFEEPVLGDAGREFGGCVAAHGKPALRFF